MTNDPRLRPMTRADARAVAELHRVGIDTGFLSSLGGAFLRQLYAALPSCPSGFGYVVDDPERGVEAFIACAESTGRLYKQSLLRRGILMAAVLLKFVVRPRVVKRMIETLRYPSEAGEELPPAEVLSIVVSERARGRGLGKALMRTAMAEFTRREISHAKVAVGADNASANAFYERCGFSLAVTRDHHGRPMNIYVAKTDPVGT